MVYTDKVFHQYEYACEHLDYIYVRMVCHRLYTAMGSPLCQYTCDRPEYMSVQMISGMLHTGMVCLQYVSGNAQLNHIHVLF